MIGLKATTKENRVTDKERNMFYSTTKTQEFHMGYITTRHTALSFVRKHCQKGATAPAKSNRH